MSAPFFRDVAVTLAPSLGECEVATRLAGARLEEVRLVHAGSGAGFCCDEPALRAALTDLRPRCALRPAARRTLLAQGCLVRACTSFGLPGHVRVSPRHSAQNDLLLEAFAALTPPANGSMR